MGLVLDTIVPWGRSHEEYCSMFALTEDDLRLRLLGCGDGPAAFNAVLTRNGGHIVSVDPLYAFTAQQIRERIKATYETVMAQLRLNQQDYVWDVIPSVAALGRVRRTAMDSFLEDFSTRQGDGRYIAGELPHLPFQAQGFDLALCSHLLFLYSDQLSLAFHIAAMLEMLRIAGQVRVFPLLTLDGHPSPHLASVCTQLTRHGFQPEIRPVNYEFQRGGNQMLVVSRTADPSCQENRQPPAQPSPTA